MNKNMRKRNLLKTCCVCDYQFSAKTYEVHMASHKDEPLTFSNNMKDSVRTVCRICDMELILTRLRGHTKDKHSITITDYKKKFNIQVLEVTEKVFHKCFLCSDIMLLDSDTIATHLHKHNITHKAYNDKYMQMTVQRKGVGTDEAKEAKAVSDFEPKVVSKVNMSLKYPNDNECEIMELEVNDKKDKVSDQIENGKDIMVQTKPQSDKKGSTELEENMVEKECIFQKKPQTIQEIQKTRHAWMDHFAMHNLNWPHQCESGVFFNWPHECAAGVYVLNCVESSTHTPMLATQGLEEVY